MSSYTEDRQAIKDEQSNLSYDEIKAKMAAQSEHIVELDNLPKQTHSWTDRGLKMTCENAGHPYHEAWKVRRSTL